MSNRARRIDPAKELRRLESRHSQLKDRVAEFEERLSLTTSEQMQLTRLKKQKLQTKDAIQRLK